jgi:hypothetical protein
MRLYHSKRLLGTVVEHPILVSQGKLKMPVNNATRYLIISSEPAVRYPSSNQPSYRMAVVYHSHVARCDGTLKESAKTDKYRNSDQECIVHVSRRFIFLHEARWQRGLFSRESEIIITPPPSKTPTSLPLIVTTESMESDQVEPFVHNPRINPRLAALVTCSFSLKCLSCLVV